jgi:hypothetical protein
MDRALPIIVSVKEVYSGVTSHFFQLISVAWLWLLVGVAAMIWMGYSVEASGIPRMTPETMQTADISAGAIAQIVVAIIIYVAATAGAAVKWHRFVLLGAYTQGNEGDVTGSALRYVWATIKIALVYILLFSIFAAALSLSASLSGMPGPAGGVVALLMGLIGAALLLVIVGVVMRLSLVLPDIALGGKGSLREMFARTSRHGMQLLGYALLMLLCLFVVIVAASFVVSLVLIAIMGADAIRTPTPQTQIIMQVIQLPVSVFAMMIGVTMLSVAYREVIGLEPQNTTQATD